MIANSWMQIIGILGQVLPVVIGVYLGWIKYLDSQLEKCEAKSKENIEIAKANVEMARNNSLTSTQVAEILKNYKEVIEELEDIKNSGDEKNARMLELINKIERIVNKQTETFTEFLMNRINK